MTIDELQAALAAERARAEKAERERDEARADNERLAGELDDAKSEPWPDWAERMKKMIRAESGYDGYDDATDGVDLPSELDDLIGEFRDVRENRDATKSRHAALLAEAQKARDHIRAAHASLLGLSGAGIATDELTKAAASLRKAIEG